MCITRVYLYLASVLMLSLWLISSAPKVLATTSYVDDSPKETPSLNCRGACHCPPGITMWALHLCTKFDISNFERSSSLNGFTLLYFAPQLVGTIVSAIIQGRNWELKSLILPLPAASLSLPDSLVLSFPTTCVMPGAMYGFLPLCPFSLFLTLRPF